MEEVLTVFSPKEDNRIPGELIVKLSAEGNLNVSTSIPSGPVRRLAGGIPSRMGIDNLDAALEDLGVKSIVKLHSAIPSTTLTAMGVRPFAVELSATYRMQFEDEKADLDEAANRLTRFGAVSEVSPNYYRWATATPDDPMYPTQWGLDKIKCPAAWDRTKGSANVIVAVVDTGVDLDHPDLASQLLPGYDCVDLVGMAPKPGWHFDGDFLTRDNNPEDEVGHGTHVAGTIAALTNNAVGVAGVTWFCKILPVKVLARMVKNGTQPPVVTGVGSAVDIAHGIRWAADHGAHIINLSLGGYHDTFFERDAVAYAVSKGCLVVAAMGNDNTSDPSYPAAYPDVLSVGAIDQAEQRAWFSNFGRHINVVAPGVNVRSTVWDNAYGNKSGTSMATPHVAGVAALLKSCKMDLTASEIVDILQDTAKPLKDAPADPVPNEKYGYGLIDAAAAVTRACGPVTPICRPFASRPTSICRPYAARPIGVCRRYTPLPWVPCSPATGRPWIPCSPATGRPWIPCSPATGRPYVPCTPSAARPHICPGSGPRPSVCSSGGPRPIPICPGGGPQPISPCDGPQPISPCGGPQPYMEPPEPPVDPYDYGYGAWGYETPQTYGTWSGEYDPGGEYGYGVWLEEGEEYVDPDYDVDPDFDPDYE